MKKIAGRPTALVSSNAILFESFFDAGLLSRLTQLTDWKRNPARAVTPALRKALRNAEVLITTWDSPPLFTEELSGLGTFIALDFALRRQRKDTFCPPAL